VLHKEIPFIRLLVPLCIGILAGYLTDIPLSVSLVTLAFSSLVLATSLLVKTLHFNSLFGGALFLLLSSFGFINVRHELSRCDTLHPSEALFVCRIKSFPEKKTNSYALTTELKGRLGDSGEMQKITGGLLLYYTPSDSVTPSIVPGDVITIRTRPIPVTNRGNPFEFDYRSFMLKKGVRYYAFIRDQSLVGHTQGSSKRTIREKALIAGRNISALYLKSGISEKNAALLSALTLGQKDLIDDETRKHFSRSGVMHIMAVSGLHAGVISMFVFSLLFFLKGRLLPLRVAISVTVLWSFAFITGLSPSVERAALMFTFLHTGRLLKRPANSINSVLAAAFFMLIVTPSDLTSLGFLLSFSAVLFINGFYKRLSTLCRSGFLPLDRLWQIAAVSLLAQMGTLPLTLNAFGFLPVWFLPANLIIIPLATIIIILSFLLLIFSPIDLVSNLLAKLLNIQLSASMRSVELISSLPKSADLGRVLPWPEAVLLMLFIISAFYYLLVMREKNLIATGISLLALLSVISLRHVNTTFTSEIIVYNTVNSISVGLRTGRTLRLVTNSDKIDQSVERHASALSLKTVPSLSLSFPLEIFFQGEKYLVTADYSPAQANSHNPDIVIAGKVPPILPVTLINNEMKIIVTSSSSNVLILTEYDNPDVPSPVHFIPEQGAWTNKQSLYNTKRGEKVD
jgi:competence protein ComEC